MDYINLYSRMAVERPGYRDYVVLKELSEKYSLSPSIGIFFLSDFKTYKSAINEEFKNLDLVAIDCIQQYDYYAKYTLQLDRISSARLNSGKPTLLFSDGNASSVSNGSSWNSLLQSCITVRLPNVR
jgi:hypothetical protein